MDQDPEDLADRDRIRAEGIRLREIIVPEWKPEQSLKSKVFAAFKWPGCWVVGIVLVTILIVNLDKDPFVIGQQTIKIEEIPFASIGFTPQGAFESDYYENARKSIKGLLEQQKISDSYKNWTIAAANKLAVVVFQLCNIQETLLQKIGLQNEASLLDQFYYHQDTTNSTTDNATDPDLKDFVIPDLKKGLRKCNETVRLVSWDNDISRNSFKFKEVITDGGLTCVINSRSSIISQKNGTVKHALSFNPTLDQIEQWKKINFDDSVKENALKHNNTLLIQKTPGKDFGLSFIAQEERKNLKCVGTDGNGFRLTLTHPRELHNVKQDGRLLQYGYEHNVRIEAVGRFLDLEVTKSPQGLRNCCLEHDKDCKSKTNQGPYSQSECYAACFSEYTLDKCNCTIIHSYEIGRHFCNLNEYHCYFENIETFYSIQKKLCQHCKPSCNDVKYSMEISSIPLPENIISKMRYLTDSSNTTDFVIVHVFFGVGEFQVTVTKQRRLFAELIGITTGMFGSAVELTLPKIMDICLILFGILGTALTICWRRSRPCRRRMRTIVTQARRLFQTRKIEPDTSLPIQILVSSRTNLVEEHTA